MADDNLIWHSADARLYVYQFGKLYTNTGVFINDRTNEAFMIDAPFGSYDSLMNSILEDVKVVALLITHGHWDHIGDDFLFKQRGAKVYAHREDKIMIETPEVMLPYIGCDIGLKPCILDYVTGDNESYTIAGVDIFVSWVPGHSVGDATFYIKSAGTIFVGDTLFRDGIGRYDFYGGDKNLLISGIKEKILTLPDDTVVIPGHGEFTSVGYESKFNSFLKKLTNF